MCNYILYLFIFKINVLIVFNSFCLMFRFRFDFVTYALARYVASFGGDMFVFFLIGCVFVLMFVVINFMIFF